MLFIPKQHTHCRKEINYFCVTHVTGHGLFSQAKGRPTQSLLPCLESSHEKIIELRKDFLLHDDTHMMVMLSICTKDMNKYVSMFPDVWFIDCSAGELISLHYLYYGHLSHTMYNFLVKGTNRQKKQLFVMAVCTANGSTLPGNSTIIPSEQKWVFHSIY
jgi:hypothetical protein